MSFGEHKEIWKCLKTRGLSTRNCIDSVWHQQTMMNSTVAHLLALLELLPGQGWDVCSLPSPWRSAWVRESPAASAACGPPLVGGRKGMRNWNSCQRPPQSVTQCLDAKISANLHDNRMYVTRCFVSLIIFANSCPGTNLHSYLI